MLKGRIFSSFSVIVIVAVLFSACKSREENTTQIKVAPVTDTVKRVLDTSVVPRPLKPGN